MKVAVGDVVLYHSGEFIVPAMVTIVGANGSATLTIFTPRGTSIRTCEYTTKKETNCWSHRPVPKKGEE